MSLVMKTAMNILKVVITYSDLLGWTFCSDSLTICYLLFITLLLNYTKKDYVIETQVTGDISSSAYRSALLKVKVLASEAKETWALTLLIDQSKQMDRLTLTFVRIARNFYFNIRNFISIASIIAFIPAFCSLEGNETKRSILFTTSVVISP